MRMGVEGAAVEEEARLGGTAMDHHRLWAGVIEEVATVVRAGAWVTAGVIASAGEVAREPA